MVHPADPMTKGKTSVAALASLCLMLASVLAPAATTGAEAANVAVPAKLYVGSGDGYSIAFEVEGEKVYVLSLDAEVYCSYTEPGELFKPRLYGFFPLPKLMREGHSGLIANESNGDNFGSETTFVQASLSGDKLVGKFGYDLSVESSHCQTGSYFPEPHSVDFEATRYVPASSPEASLPVAGESKIYFLDEEPLEVFIRVEGSELFLRGSVVSRCHSKRGPPVGGRSSGHPHRRPWAMEVNSTHTPAARPLRVAGPRRPGEQVSRRGRVGPRCAARPR